jgi:hypothetical protein
LVGKPEGKPRRRWKDNIEVTLKKNCLNSLEIIHEVQEKKCSSENDEYGDEYRELVGKPEGKPRRRWKDNIEVTLKKIV